jgi:hypothetical protein
VCHFGTKPPPRLCCQSEIATLKSPSGSDSIGNHSRQILGCSRTTNSGSPNEDPHPAYWVSDGGQWGYRCAPVLGGGSVGKRQISKESDTAAYSMLAAPVDERTPPKPDPAAAAPCPCCFNTSILGDHFLTPAPHAACRLGTIECSLTMLPVQNVLDIPETPISGTRKPRTAKREVS